MASLNSVFTVIAVSCVLLGAAHTDATVRKMLQAAPSPGVANASADCDAGSFRLGPFCFANVTALSLPGRAESTSFSMGANDLGSGTGDASAIAVGENAQTNTVTDVQLNDGVTTVSSSSVAISG